MVKHRAFFYRFNRSLGVGVLAHHQYEGWQRANLYAFGVDMDAFLKNLEEKEEALIQYGIMACRTAQSRVVVAGGVVFKGVTCLAAEGVDAQRILSAIEDGVEGFKVADTGSLKVADAISPLEVRGFSYGGKVIGISKVVFFEYATQVSLAGIYRDQDRNLLDELHAGLSGLNAYMTIPSPLLTLERDPRVELNLFLLRAPLKEELQSDFVQAIKELNGLEFYVL